LLRILGNFDHRMRTTEALSFANVHLCAGERTEVFVMQSAKDRLGMDGIQFSAASANLDMGRRGLAGGL
jgi:hypothetical protein